MSKSKLIVRGWEHFIYDIDKIVYIKNYANSRNDLSYSEFCLYSISNNLKFNISKYNPLNLNYYCDLFDEEEQNEKFTNLVSFTEAFDGKRVYFLHIPIYSYEFYGKDYRKYDNGTNIIYSNSIDININFISYIDREKIHLINGESFSAIDKDLLEFNELLKEALEAKGRKYSILMDRIKRHKENLFQSYTEILYFIFKNKKK